MERLIITLFLLLLLGIANNTLAEEVNAEFDITSTAIIVNWFDTEAELQDALEDYEIGGLSECEWRPDSNISFCELWLVRPIELDTWTEDIEQDKWKTIGHEFYHALAGSFHDE